MNIDFELVDFLKNKIIGIYEQSKEIFDLNIENKEGNDIVTDVDLFMEKEIIKVIKEIFPEHSIHGEELGESISKSEYEWLLDKSREKTFYQSSARRDIMRFWRLPIMNKETNHEKTTDSTFIHLHDSTYSLRAGRQRSAGSSEQYRPERDCFHFGDRRTGRFIGIIGSCHGARGRFRNNGRCRKDR